MKRGEALQKSQDAEEEVVEQLVRTVEEVDEKHRAVVGEGDFVELLQKFPVMSSHKAPKGYGHARVMLEAAGAVMLSFCGEEELENEATESGRNKDNNRSFRSNSFSDNTRRRTPSRQMVRSRSLLQARGKPDNLLESADTNDVASRTSTPTSRRSALAVSDINDVYEEEVSLTVPSVAASTPQFPRTRKSVVKNQDIPSSDAPATSQDAERGRQRGASQCEDMRPMRPRDRGQRRRRRRGDREGAPSGHRRSVHSLCSLM